MTHLHGRLCLLCAVLDDIAAAVDPLNVEQLHAESAPGQFEIVTGHKEALEVPALPSLTFKPHDMCR